MLIGDAGLDVAEEFLTALAQAYEEEQGRKPILEELLESLRSVLDTDPAAYISSADNIEVIALKAKTKALPKRQKLRPGSIFAIPLKNGYYGFGRMTPQFLTADIYQVKSKKKLSARILQTHPHVRYEPMISENGFRKGGWVVYDYLEYPYEGFEVTIYRAGNRIYCGHKIEDGFISTAGESRVAPSEEYEKIPPLAIDNLEMSIHRIEGMLENVPVIG